MRSLVATFALCLLASVSSSAQERGASDLYLRGIPSDSVLIMRLMGDAVRTPARFALDHRAELELSDSQVAQLTAVQAALGDSVLARRARALHRVPSDTNHLTMSARVLMQWEGPLDEAVVRAESCAQSKAISEAMMDMLRDRLRVGALLTAEQRAKLMPLQMADLTKAMQP